MAGVGWAATAGVAVQGGAGRGGETGVHAETQSDAVRTLSGVTHKYAKTMRRTKAHAMPRRPMLDASVQQRPIFPRSDVTRGPRVWSSIAARSRYAFVARRHTAHHSAFKSKTGAAGSNPGRGIVRRRRSLS